MTKPEETSYYTKFLHTRLRPSEETLYREAAAIVGTSLANWVRQTLTAEAQRIVRRQRRLKQHSHSQGVAA